VARLQSVVELWNQALRHVGHTPLTDEDDEGNPGDTLREVWPTTRDMFVEAYDWFFARRYLTLDVVLDDAEIVNDWAYAYDYPAPDVLSVRRLIDPQDRDLSLPFEVTPKQESLDWKLMCDIGGSGFTPTVQVTLRVDNVAYYPDSFVYALSYQLAADIVGSIAKSPRALQIASAYADRAHVVAQRVSAGQQYPRSTERIPGPIKARY
jgi:hypothetical protein